MRIAKTYRGNGTRGDGGQAMDGGESKGTRFYWQLGPTEQAVQEPQLHGEESYLAMSIHHGRTLIDTPVTDLPDPKLPIWRRGRQALHPEDFRNLFSDTMAHIINAARWGGIDPASLCQRAMETADGCWEESLKAAVEREEAHRQAKFNRGGPRQVTVHVFDSMGLQGPEQHLGSITFADYAPFDDDADTPGPDEIAARSWNFALHLMEHADLGLGFEVVGRDDDMPCRSESEGSRHKFPEIWRALDAIWVEISDLGSFDAESGSIDVGQWLAGSRGSSNAEPTTDDQ